MALRRAIAFVFGLLSLTGGETLWWVDIRPLPQWLVALPGLVLLVHAIWPRRLHRAATDAAALLAAVALRNAVRYLALPLPSRPPVPLSLPISVLLALAAFPPPRPRSPLAAVAIAALLLALFPLAHVFTFGRTSYARAADWIVVPGARCYADGTPSQALKERVRTACRLYREGYGKRLFLSGGPGDGATHEVDAMRALALEGGVPAGGIVLDRDGWDTQSTIRHAPPGRLLVVSHFYHLPRIKMLARQQRRDAYTVPADEEREIRGTPRFVAREIAAFWWYLLVA
ncbi:MAG TPA: YdcF family protein [Planctomycetota bacterium]|nr:YdcF family protein [Planctomycetota bacterium]